MTIDKKKSKKPGFSSKTGKNKTPGAIPKTAQQTIPYLDAYENGVLQVEPCVFSRTFEFEDISFKTASDEDQEEIYTKFQKFLNSITPKEDIQFSIVNLKEDSKNKLDMIAPIMRGDKYDVYRKETADMLRGKIDSARNNIATKKYMTVRFEGDTVEKAMQRDLAICGEQEQEFKRVTKQNIKSLDLAARLELLNILMNSDEKNYWFEHDENGKVRVDFAKMAKQGRTTKDIIAPSALKFNPTDFVIGERVGQTMYMENIANWMNTNFLSDLCEVNFESVVSLHIQAIPQADAVKMIHHQSVNITAEVMEKQKQAIKGGYNPDFISADLKNAKEQIDELQQDMMNRDQKLFYFALTLTHFAPDKETLKEQTNIIRQIGNKHMCSIKPLAFQQEKGFVSCLPLGLNRTYTTRLLTTESLGIFMPFNEMTQCDPGGFYYGVNAINKSLIIYDRLKGMNYNGLILGSSGSGKSFSAKREMTSAWLNTGADVFIIDPDGEYSKIAEEFDGQVIKIAPGNRVFINPFDLDIDTSRDGEYNPMTMKTDFIAGMIETMMGYGAQLSPTQRSILDRCIQQMYKPYYQHLHEQGPDPITGERRTIDRNVCPSMQQLFDILMSQPQPEAQNMALIMETYTTGSFDTFAHRTNVDVDNRMIVYDIRDIGSNLKELGLKVCMNDIWLRMIANRAKNKWTYFYIDEFHLLMNNPSTSSFLQTVWRRARKWQGVPTGITQGVEDLLKSPDARTIINNSSFIQMLNQSAINRSALQNLLNLSDSDVEFITNAEPGHGLLYVNGKTIPFADDYPKNTKLYKAMTSKAGE